MNFLLPTFPIFNQHFIFSYSLHYPSRAGRSNTGSKFYMRKCLCYYSKLTAQSNQQPTAGLLFMAERKTTRHVAALSLTVSMVSSDNLEEKNFSFSV